MSKNPTSTQSEMMTDTELNRALQTATTMNGVFEAILAPTSRQKWLAEAGEKARKFLEESKNDKPDDYGAGETWYQTFRDIEPERLTRERK